METIKTAEQRFDEITSDGWTGMNLAAVRDRLKDEEIRDLRAALTVESAALTDAVRHVGSLKELVAAMSKQAEAAPVGADDGRRNFVAYWRKHYKYGPTHAFLDEFGNFCTPKDDPIHVGWEAWQAALAQRAGSGEFKPVAYRVKFDDFRHFSGATATGQDYVKFQKPDLDCGFFNGCNSLVITPLYAAPPPQPDSGRLAELYAVIGKVIDGTSELNITKLHDWLGGEDGLPAEAVLCDPEPDSGRDAALNQLFDGLVDIPEAIAERIATCSSWLS